MSGLELGPCRIASEIIGLKELRGLAEGETKMTGAQDRSCE